MHKSVEDLIRAYIPFVHGITGDGWHRVYCEVCGDGSRTKGPRGGWRFTDGGDTAIYHCFNLNCAGTFSTQRAFPFSRGMKDILDKFGIPSKDYMATAHANILDGTKPQTIKKPTNPIFIHKELELPGHFYQLADAKKDNVLAKQANDFLRANYGLDKSSFSFYLSTGIPDAPEPKAMIEAKSMVGRIIIPYYKNGKLIYYQGRDFTDSKPKKYVNAEVPRSNILFNIDALFLRSDDPLYIVEGAFDAIHLGGVATLENNISSQQIELLEKCHRRKILVPDFKGDSQNQIEVAIKQGWEVALPEFRSSCKDVSESIVKFGKLYTFYDIVNNIKSSHEAAMLLPFLKKL